MNDIKELLNLMRERPILSLVMLLILSGGSGASIGAFATRSAVEEKHAQAMFKIDGLERDRDQMQKQLDRIENKIDRIILRVR